MNDAKLTRLALRYLRNRPAGDRPLRLNAYHILGWALCIAPESQTDLAARIVLLSEVGTGIRSREV